MIKVIPAIDLIEGKCVRLSQGNYNACKVYSANPLDIAKEFEDCGTELLHIVDLDGAKASSPVNLHILETIASRTSLKCEFGGGIKSRESLSSALSAGAYRVICGSIACNSPELFTEWLIEFGHHKVLFGADLKDGRPAVNGWLESGNNTIEDLLEKFIGAGLASTIVTDISRDGMLNGPSFDLYKRLIGEFPGHNFIASGGISNMTDILKLNEIGIKEVIAGKALYEGKISKEELVELNKML